MKTNGVEITPEIIKMVVRYCMAYHYKIDKQTIKSMIKESKTKPIEDVYEGLINKDNPKKYVEVFTPEQVKEEENYWVNSILG